MNNSAHNKLSNGDTDVFLLLNCFSLSEYKLPVPCHILTEYRI